MSDLQLPARLDLVLDNVGTGAVLRRMPDDALAVVIGYALIPDEGFLVCRLKPRLWKKVRADAFKDEAGTYEDDLDKPKSFVVELLDNYEEWLVLTWGGDYSLNGE